MATKTISLELDAYERLKRAKRSPRESFSSVVRRGHWNEERSTGAEALVFLRRLRDSDPEALLSEATLAQVETRAASRGKRARPRRAKS